MRRSPEPPGTEAHTILAAPPMPALAAKLTKIRPRMSHLVSYGMHMEVAWADPETAISFAYLTNGPDTHAREEGARGVALADLAARGNLFP